MNAIRSIKSQTYNNIEIIVVNDCSTEKEYYEYNWEKEEVIMINLPENSKKKFGFACAAAVRNTGIEKSKGKYVAFCDDDDIWFPKKIELQLKAMRETGCKMSSTDGLIGKGVYDGDKRYKKYLGEFFWNFLYKKLKIKKLPKIWDLKFLKIHNCMICSSVIVQKELLRRINNFNTLKPPGEDYNCWLRLLEHTNSVYVEEPCFYYDSNHGDGQNY